MAKIPTEFDARRLPENKYCFEVTEKATKPEIRAAIEQLFDVKVKKVNTHILPASSRRVGKFAGKRSQYKRAIITLVDGDRIELFPETN